MVKGKKKSKATPSKLQAIDEENESNTVTDADSGGEWTALWHAISTMLLVGAMFNIIIIGGAVLEIEENLCLGTCGVLAPVVVVINYLKYKAATTPTPTHSPDNRTAYAHLQDKQDGVLDEDSDQPQTPPHYNRARRPSQDPVGAISPVTFTAPLTPSFDESLIMSNEASTAQKAASLARIVSAVPPICELNQAKDKEIESLQARVSQLSSELESSKQEQDRLATQNDKMIDQLGSKSPPRQDAKLVLESKNNELASLRAENSNLKRDKETLTEQVSELKENLSQQEKALETERAAAQEAANIPTDEDSLQKRLHESTRRNIELKKTIEDLQGLLRAAKAGAVEGECGELVNWKRREEEVRRAHLNLIIREEPLLTSVIEKLESKRISSLTLTALTSEEASVLSAVFKAKAHQATTLLQSLTFASHCADSLTVITSEAPFPMDAEACSTLASVSKQLNDIIKSAGDLPSTFESAVDALPVTMSSEFFAP